MPEETQQNGWIDISVPLYTGMVHWPDNPSCEIQQTMSIGSGDTCNLSRLSMGVHTGTHMDAPLHFIHGGKSIDMLPLEATVGRARVLEISDPQAIRVAELEPYAIQPGERILFKTINSIRAWKSDVFVEDFVYISHEAAQYLAAKRIQAVGVDYLSVGGYRVDGPETHHALLGAEIWVIEGLNLANVQAGTYELICLPLKMMGAEGAPARAILRPLV